MGSAAEKSGWTSADYQHTLPASKETDVSTRSASSTSSENERLKVKSQSLWQRLLYWVFWTPRWCRWDPQNPPVFSMWTNLLFAFAGAFTVANLYYSQPILNVLAVQFNVSYEESSHIPTLSQAGYATGLFFVCPLGDMVRRRHFILLCIFISATLWIVLCTTTNFAVFQALTFLTGITTVTPQIISPLVGDLAPPHRRATALSVITSGNLLGILLARILSGVVTNYTSWRNIYWLAFGLQSLILILMWICMPDYPATNKNLNYLKVLWDVLYMLRKHPTLVQAGLVCLSNSAVFTCFWTTLTFLLASPPYEYSPLAIGLFALIGLAGMVAGPLFARNMIDQFVPLFSAFVGQFLGLIGAIVGAYTGKFTVAGPVIMAFLLDVSFMITSIANRSAIFTLEPKARSRINTTFMLCNFMGQITGTAAGNRLYAQAGWVGSASLGVAFVVFSVLVLLLRGPWEEGWVGWHGGCSVRKKNKLSADGKTTEVMNYEIQPGNPEPNGIGTEGVTDVQQAVEVAVDSDGVNPVRETVEAKGREHV